MIQFIDLQAQQNRIRTEIDHAIKRVLDHGAYIMGPEIDTFEQDLSSFCGAKHSISCSSGTDALSLILMALGASPGDAVFVPSFTYIATAEIVCLLGATPIFVDINPDTYNIDLQSLKAGYAIAKEHGLKPTGVIPVDLFGQCADYAEIETFCQEENIWLLSDAAQSFGATYQGRKVGTIGIATATSFFPAKPLGCYGDGGAVFTNDDELAHIMKSIRVHGKGTDKYDNIRIGLNARMDTMQAAILIEKLKIFSDELEERNTLASRYTNALHNVVKTPFIQNGNSSTWAQYTIRVNANKRDQLIRHLNDNDIPTAVYYPIPLHKQKGYAHYPNTQPLISEQCASEVLSLPMHPYMDNDTSGMIIEKLTKAMEILQ